MSAIIVGAKIINSKVLEAKIAAAFEEWTRTDVNQHFEEEFNEKKWNYPLPETKRKKRPPAGDPRDIIDTGDLYRSGKESFKIMQGSNDITASWDWNAKNSSGNGYAWYVHEGLSTNRAPRQWTDVFQQQDLFIASDISKALRARIRAAFL